MLLYDIVVVNVITAICKLFTPQIAARRSQHLESLVHAIVNQQMEHVHVRCGSINVSQCIILITDSVITDSVITLHVGRGC